jgi:hypothetical protein
LNEITQADLPLVYEIYLVLTNLFRPEQLRRLSEMPGELSDAANVPVNGVHGPVAYAQVVNDALTKSSHGKLLSKRECSFGDKHCALLKRSFSTFIEIVDPT